MFNDNSSNNNNNRRKPNAGMDQLDFRLILAFTNAYEKLYSLGEISEDQFEKVLDLLEDYQGYSKEEFKAELKKIFPE
ncbi:hypothetical protein [Natronospora cellulosivora (SeqCode)]